MVILLRFYWQNILNRSINLCQMPIFHIAYQPTQELINISSPKPCRSFFTHIIYLPTLFKLIFAFVVDERNGWIKLKKDIESSNVPRILISPHAQFRLLLAERGIMDNRRYKFHSKSFIIVHYLFSMQISRLFKNYFSYSRSV